MAEKNKKVYLDYAATTPVDPKVLQVMLPFLKEDFGNPFSIHSWGQKAKVAIENAREKVAKFLNCSSSEVIFLSSATEANNLAIKGLISNIPAFARASAGRQYLKSNRPHIITSKIEHSAVLEPCRILEKQGLVEVSYLPVSKDGLVRVLDVKKEIKSNTVLISVMYANNEIGTIQPISEIGKLIKEINLKKDQKIYFHTDAVQAVNYLNCDVKKLEVDLFTLSSHKIYGPKGIAGLYIKQGTPLKPLINGGGQEFGLKSGTENVAGIVGFGKAVEGVSRNKNKTTKIKKLRDELIDGALKTIPNSRLNGSRENRLPNNTNFSFKGVEGEALVIALDQEGIASSTGSACSSKELKASHVLLALGLSPESAHCSLRITLSKLTTEQEIEYILKVLPKVIARLRKISGYRL